MVGTNTTGTGEASVQLNENGTPIPGSLTSGTIASNNNTTTLAATAIIDAAAADVITLTMVGTGFSFTNASMAIEKLD